MSTCTHYFGFWTHRDGSGIFTSTGRCENEPAAFLVAPDGQQVPGGPLCRDCASRIVTEYREKLDERWTTMPTQDAVHAFLARHYKRDRFEGRNGETWGPDYSQVIARGRLEDLREHGHSLISHHESRTGEAIYFTTDLEPLESHP